MSDDDVKTGGGDAVKFEPFSSFAEASFWIKLSDMKLHELRLSEEPVAIRGSYGPGHRHSRRGGDDPSAIPARMRVDRDSLSLPSDGPSIRNEVVRCDGTITVFNTVEAFKRCDKNETLRRSCEALMKSIEDEDVKGLTSFVCLCHLDLKKHAVVYWFAFPALATRVGKSVRYACASDVRWKAKELCGSFHEMRRKTLHTPAYFMVLNLGLEENDSDLSVRCLPLSSSHHSELTSEEKSNVVFGFVDPSSRKDHPGWPMRNLVAYLSLKLKLPPDTPVQILSFRPILHRIPNDNYDTQHDDKDSSPQSNDHASILFSVLIPHPTDYVWNQNHNDKDSTEQSNDPPLYKSSGWEPNTRYKMGPRSITLRSMLDPLHLATQAVNLNLNLMKWRMIPQLNTQLLQNHTKCLLLGAGTLGCNVARTLLGWGVRHITFVDNGRVSYSNPVRQSLFTLDDCKNGGRYKATAASDAVMQIAPNVTTRGVVYSIPMPGHAMEDKSAILEDLILNHDVVFLLTDTRESRWLPTLIAAKNNTVLINAALGLDTWLVMRHGGGILPNGPHNRLGCYFCNDVVAPENSTKERTLDQQCTVTRPGLAPIASSMAVELMVTLLHHPLRQFAPAEPNTAVNTTPLGILPHQIRGSLTSYNIMTPFTPSFTYCTACSDAVVQAYREGGEEFVRKVCRPDTEATAFLERLTGLAEFRSKAEMADLDWDESDEE